MENAKLQAPVSVMLVDDHTLVRQGFVNILTLRPEFKVVGEANQVELALEKVAALKPDIVLMDIKIPGSELDGIEATRQITRDFPEVKVIILSMWDKEEDVLKAVKSGALGYILKDVSREELFNALRIVAQGEAYIQPQLAYKVIGKLAQSSGLLQDAEHAPVELSQRQSEVLKLVTQGMPSKNIAATLKISIKTVKTHLRLIFHKLEVSNRAQAVAYAMKYNLFE